MTTTTPEEIREEYDKEFSELIANWRVNPKDRRNIEKLSSDFWLEKLAQQHRTDVAWFRKIVGKDITQIPLVLDIITGDPEINKLIAKTMMFTINVEKSRILSLLDKEDKQENI